MWMVRSTERPRHVTFADFVCVQMVENTDACDSSHKPQIQIEAEPLRGEKDIPARLVSKLITGIARRKLTSLESVLEVLHDSCNCCKWLHAPSPGCPAQYDRDHHLSLVCQVEAKVEAILRSVQNEGTSFLHGLGRINKSHVRILTHLQIGLCQAREVVLIAEKRLRSRTLMHMSENRACALKLALWAIRHARDASRMSETNMCTASSA